MKDSGNTAWLEVYGVNGNRALKVMMTETAQEDVNMSLYAPINKNAEWNLSSSADSVCKEASFVDASWTSVTLGSTTQQVTGTQYLRKAFTGLNDMAALEIALNDRFGMIAYINGQQVYRDNMPEGEVSLTTSATGGYSSYDYRGVYRSAVASSSQSVLAVELHFINSTPNTLDFNAYLTLYAGIRSDSRSLGLHRYEHCSEQGQQRFLDPQFLPHGWWTGFYDRYQYWVSTHGLFSAHLARHAYRQPSLLLLHWRINFGERTLHGNLLDNERTVHFQHVDPVRSYNTSQPVLLLQNHCQRRTKLSHLSERNSIPRLQSSRFNHFQLSRRLLFFLQVLPASGHPPHNAWNHFLYRLSPPS